MGLCLKFEYTQYAIFIPMSRYNNQKARPFWIDILNLYYEKALNQSCSRSKPNSKIPEKIMPSWDLGVCFVRKMEREIERRECQEFEGGGPFCLTFAMVKVRGRVLKGRASFAEEKV